MKIIVSHDIDHLNWSEHYFQDLFILKLFLRSTLMLLRGQISIKTALSRCNIFADKRINRLNELTEFLRHQEIRSTFFIAFSNGLNLSYSTSKAIEIGEKLIDQNFLVGVHGIEFNHIEKINEEKVKALPILSKQSFAGIRMHYLRSTDKTKDYLSKTLYNYDSTEYCIKNPYLVRPNLWSFPISVMDTYVIERHNHNLDLAKRYTCQLLKKANDCQLKYFVINFHDLYFDDNAYSIYKNWFIWLIDHLKKEGFEFSDFEQALLDLNSNSNNNILC
jgi:hypothetical protein